MINYKASGITIGKPGRPLAPPPIKIQFARPLIDLQLVRAGSRLAAGSQFALGGSRIAFGATLDVGRQ